MKDTNNLLTNDELADLFGYCARLSSLVSPRDAMRYYHFTFDGAVTDTFYGLAMLYAGEGIARNATDFKQDGLYGPTLQQMLADIRAILDGRPGVQHNPQAVPAGIEERAYRLCKA